MADNRMYLRCRGCGAEMMLGKLLGGTWYSPQEGKCQLSRFMTNHSDCCKGLEHDTCGGISPFNPYFEPFELIYENNEEWGHRQTLQDRDRKLHPEDYE